MNIYKLMQKYGLEHGLENDQRHLDAFVKELEKSMSDVIGKSKPLPTPVISEGTFFMVLGQNALKARQGNALNLFFNNQ